MPTRSAWLWLRWSSSVRTRRKKSRRLKRTNRPSSEDWIVDAGLGDRANPCSGHHRCGTAPESHRTSLRSTSHQLPPMRPPGYSTRAQTVKTPRGSPRRRNPGVDARVALPPRQTCFPIPVIGSDANSQTPYAGVAGLYAPAGGDLSSARSRARHQIAANAASSAAEEVVGSGATVLLTGEAGLGAGERMFRCRLGKTQISCLRSARRELFQARRRDDCLSGEAAVDLDDARAVELEAGGSPT